MTPNMGFGPKLLDCQIVNMLSIEAACASFGDFWQRVSLLVSLANPFRSTSNICINLNFVSALNTFFSNCLLPNFVSYFHIVTQKFSINSNRQPKSGGRKSRALLTCFNQRQPIFRVEKRIIILRSNMLVIDFLLPFDRRANALGTADRPCVRQMSSRCAAWRCRKRALAAPN